MPSRSRRAVRARFAGNVPFLSQQREQGNAGCALHPRSRVQLCEKLRTRAYRFSGNTPASPAQWLYGLWRALLGDEFCLVTVIGEYGLSKPGWADAPPPI